MKSDKQIAKNNALLSESSDVLMNELGLLGFYNKLSAIRVLMKAYNFHGI